MNTTIVSVPFDTNKLRLWFDYNSALSGIFPKTTQKLIFLSFLFEI